MANVDLLHGLSEEEREAIGDDEGMAELSSGLRRGADDGEPPAPAPAPAATTDDDPDDDTPPADPPAPTPAPAPADEPPTEPAAAADDDEDDPPLRVQFAYDLVEGYDDKVGALTTALADLKAKFRAGELDAEEYDDQRDKLAEEKATLVRQQELALFERKTTESNARAQWDRAVDRFLGENKQYDDELLYSALNVAIKKIAETPESAEKSNRWVLMKAHEEVQKRFGRAVSAPAAAPTPAPKDPAQVRQAAVEARRPKAAGPKTLAEAPAAAATEAASGEFADLEGLDGIELERRLARMSPEAADRFLRGY